MTFLERRRALIAAAMDNASILPSGYTQLEYIQSNGSQYIVTDFVPDHNTKVIVDYQYTELTATFIFGSRNASGTDAYTLSMSSSKYLVSSYGNIKNQSVASGNTERHQVKKDKNLVYYDNKLRNTLTENEFECPNPLTIFACYYASNKGYAPSKAKIYSFKIYDNDVLVRDYIPCTNPSGITGLYDVINQEFLGFNN